MAYPWESPPIARLKRSHCWRVRARAVWVAVAASPEVILPIAPWLAWSITGLGALPLARPGFDVQLETDRKNAFHSSALATQVLLGVRGEL